MTRARGVRKFRNIEEMNEAQRPHLETDPRRALEQAASLYQLYRAAFPTGFKGVHKFRTIEESNRFRVEWMQAAIRQRDQAR